MLKSRLFFWNKQEKHVSKIVLEQGRQTDIYFLLNAFILYSTTVTEPSPNKSWIPSQNVPTGAVDEIRGLEGKDELV